MPYGGSLWGSRSRLAVLISSLCCTFVLVDQAVKHRSMFDALVAEVGSGVAWSRWVKFAGLVRLLAVVVSNVLRERRTQVVPAGNLIRAR